VNLIWVYRCRPAGRPNSSLTQGENMKKIVGSLLMACILAAPMAAFAQDKKDDSMKKEDSMKKDEMKKEKKEKKKEAKEEKKEKKDEMKKDDSMKKPN
jgi:pentapeptide MXKDX repeat protein